MNLKEIKDAARKAFRDQQSQDTEGGVPDAVSFITGFVDGAIYRQDEMLIATVDKLKEENKKLVEALKFYANQENWMGYHRDVDTIRSSDCEPAKAIEDNFDIRLGGKLARQVLKEIGEE